MINADKLLKLAENSGCYLESDFLSEVMIYRNFTDLSELEGWLNMCDDVHEWADGSVDIYNYDLRQWAVDNYNYIEEGINELGAPEPFDFHKAIQYGQYHYYCQQAYKDCNEFLEWLKERYEW